MTVAMREAAPQGEPRRRLWTRQEFRRLAELGMFAPNERIELIEGEFIEKMSQNPPHSIAMTLASEVMQRIFHTGHHVRVQCPFVVSNISQPEPDIAVVSGEVRDYLAEHPDVAALLIEVSDYTLAADRSTKASLYARAGIADYWVLNLIDRVLEIHRQPAPMEGQLYGYHYRSITRHTETDIVFALAAPQSEIRVADLLP